jgi:hypothetical protein
MRRPPVLLALVCLLLLAIPPVVLRAAITVTEMYVGGVTTNASSYTSNSGGTNPLTGSAGSSPFAIATGAVLLCGVTWSDSDAPDSPVLVHDGTTLTASLGVSYESGVAAKLYYAAGPLASSHVSFTVSEAQTGMGVACYEVAGADVSSPILQEKAGEDDDTTGHSITMDDARTTGAVLFHWTAANAAVGTRTPEYAGIGSLAQYDSPSARGVMQWDIGGSDTTPLMTTANVVDSGQVAIEIAIAPTGGTKPQMLMLGVGEQ